ncbi:hypothetical protein [Nocardia sp. NPDC059239]|uniref:hypothetical protein n=1 Tax=unclassified Nocardia TaxID=2637762 RepID=UPI0036CBE1F5
MSITIEQLQNLWNNANPNAIIDRGDDAPVTKDDLAALAAGVDTDDNGTPEPDQWQILADQLNDTDTAATDPWLDQIADVTTRRTAARDAADAADEVFNAVIRAAAQSKRVGITAIAAAAGISRERVYQIRDGRR